MTTSTSQKVVLVTGASSGIGSATTTLLAERGHQVVPGARRTERLKYSPTTSTQPTAAPSATPWM